MRRLLLLGCCLALWLSPVTVFADTAPVDKPVDGKPLAGATGKPLGLSAKDHATTESGAPAQAPDMAGGIAQVTFGLFVVLIVIGAAAWFARRFGHFNVSAGGNLRILGGLHMGSRERVVLLQVGNKQLLLGVAPGRIQTLHVLDEPIALDQVGNPPGHNPVQRFSSLLKRYQQP